MRRWILWPTALLCALNLGFVAGDIVFGLWHDLFRDVMMALSNLVIFLTWKYLVTPMKLKINVKAEAVQAKFWIRLFKLEEEIEHVRLLMAEANTPRKWASVPIVNEFEVDKDLEFAYVLLFTVDAVGPKDVIGQVFICDQSNREEIIEVRDKLADEVMKWFSERHDKVVAEGQGEYHDQITVIEPGKEDAEIIPPASNAGRAPAKDIPPDPDL